MVAANLEHVVSEKLKDLIKRKIAPMLPKLIEQEVDAQVGDFLSKRVGASLIDRKVEPMGQHRKPGRPPGQMRVCQVVGCPNKHRSQGYCAAHYQAARKHKWPMPSPKGFRPTQDYHPKSQPAEHRA